MRLSCDAGARKVCVFTGEICEFEGGIGFGLKEDI